MAVFAFIATISFPFTPQRLSGLLLYLISRPGVASYPSIGDFLFTGAAFIIFFALQPMINQSLTSGSLPY